MVELKPTDAVVGDPEAAEDAEAVTRPNVRPHGRVDRIERQLSAAPVLGRVATEHVWVERCRWALRRPQAWPPEGVAPR